MKLSAHISVGLKGCGCAARIGTRRKVTYQAKKPIKSFSRSALHREGSQPSYDRRNEQRNRITNNKRQEPWLKNNPDTTKSQSAKLGLTPGQYEQLLEDSSRDVNAILYTGSYTGMRLGEILNFTGDKAVSSQ